MRELSELGEAYYSHGLSVGGFVVTKDGKYIFGQKASKSVSSLKHDIIGGVLEKIDPMSGEGVLNMNKVELEEEINVSAHDINDIKIIGLVRSPSTDIVIVTFTTLNILADELKSLFEKRRDLELEAIEFIDSENLNNYLNKLGGYKPAMARLLNP